MKTMSLLLITGLCSGIFLVESAKAEIKEPEAYLRLTAFEKFSPAEAPQMQTGRYELSSSESRYREKLPVQLGGAIRKVSRSNVKKSRKEDSLF